ncbi:MAG: cytochrome P460 family protein [Bryobacteraceae bacterium]
MRSFLLFAAFLVAVSQIRAADRPSVPGPVYNAAGNLVRPVDYREWIFLTAGMGMTYGPNGPAPGEEPRFDNVFVNPAAYREFVKTGEWPNGSIFILEIRKGEPTQSINRGGRTQTALVAVEAAVKDETHFPEKWAYFNFPVRRGEASADTKAFPKATGCYSCHNQHGAVDNTFVQFYPTLVEIAKAKGTWKAPAEAAK